MARFPVSFLHEIAWEDREGTERVNVNGLATEIY